MPSSTREININQNSISNVKMGFVYPNQLSPGQPHYSHGHCCAILLPVSRHSELMHDLQSSYHVSTDTDLKEEEKKQTRE